MIKPLFRAVNENFLIILQVMDSPFTIVLFYAILALALDGDGLT
jgi:hypothetical protein